MVIALMVIQHRNSPGNSRLLLGLAALLPTGPVRRQVRGALGHKHLVACAWTSDTCIRKKFWLMPIIISMLLLGVLIILAQGSAEAAFIYTLF